MVQSQAGWLHYRTM